MASQIAVDPLLALRCQCVLADFSTRGVQRAKVSVRRGDVSAHVQSEQENDSCYLRMDPMLAGLLRDHLVLMSEQLLQSCLALPASATGMRWEASFDFRSGLVDLRRSFVEVSGAGRIAAARLFLAVHPPISDIPSGVTGLGEVDTFLDGQASSGPGIKLVINA